MATVKRLVADLAAGLTTIGEVMRDFRSRPWPAGRRELTDGQMHGTEDVPPPTDNSPDWIEIEPDLTEQQRAQLRAAYDVGYGK